MSKTPEAQTAALLADPVARAEVERSVSCYLDRDWRIRRAESRAEEASHAAVVLSDGVYGVFVKAGTGEPAREQIAAEAGGLSALSERAGVFTPAVVAVRETGRWTLMIMEALSVQLRHQDQAREMGAALARVHSVKGDAFGFPHHCYWGDLFQDNTPEDNWPTFFAARRIEPRLRAAVDSGNLPASFVPKVHAVARRLPELCGPAIAPTLLHGDAHQNNFLPTARGVALIDPAVYHGHPEVDLAFIDFFSPVPHAFFDGYASVGHLDAGFPARKQLWRIPAWLAMVEVDGPQHLPALRAALEAYTSPA